MTSANVACGCHAGDPTTMQRVCAVAAPAARVRDSLLDAGGVTVEPFG